MIVRFESDSAASRAQRVLGWHAVRATVVAASFLFCGLAAAQSGASAAQPAAASAVAASTAGQYIVHSGQSLHDVAVDLTQTHDKAALARMSQALFAANPNAFIKQDPSRMRVGATLNVPATPDLSSAAAGMTAAAVATPANAPATAATAAAASAASESAPATASSAAAHTVPAASTAAAATAGASSASAAATVGAPSAAVGTSAPEAVAQGASGAAAAGASSAAPASAASDSHVWSGAVQATPASGASAQGAKGSPVTVSSLQQLLALKNRVLMALQQHGIGKPAQTAGGASAGAPAAQGGAPVQTGAAAGGQPEISPVAMGAVGAIVVALLALFVRLLMRKRNKPVGEVSEATSETQEPAPAASEAAAEEPPLLHEPIAHAADQPRVNEAEPPVTAEADAVSITPVPTPVVAVAPLEHDATPAHAPGAESHDDEALAPTLTETLHPATPEAQPVAQTTSPLHDEASHGIEPQEPQTLAGAVEAASLAAAAELGAEALPPESVAASRAAEDAEARARALEEPAQQPQEPAASANPADFADGAPQTAQAEPPVAQPPHLAEVFERPSAPGVARDIPSAPVVPAADTSYPEVPIAFPHDAIEALGGIDLPLPPRIVEPGEPVVPPEPLSTEPAATPEASARLSSPFFEPPAPLAGEAIEAGTAGAGALAGLGAPRFGALTLDFDLNLPPDSAEPLPVFTPEQLARIARNKLDLAKEYIALGDVAGARSLINEVIESNDHATRSDAQALLSMLAPLS